jgi:hypothetical protein
MLRPLLFIVPVVMVLGCESPGPRLNAPPHGDAEEVSNLRDQYEHMIDNALLADMSVNDAHFLPHRPLLNSLGEERLARIAALIEMYGGEVRFNAADRDEKLIAARTNSIVEFLREQGVDVASDGVVMALPGGRGVDATQAIVIRAGEGTYKPKRGAGGSSSTGGGSSGGASTKSNGN